MPPTRPQQGTVTELAMTPAQQYWFDSVGLALKVYKEQSVFGSFFRSSGSQNAYTAIRECFLAVQQKTKTIDELKTVVTSHEKQMGQKLSLVFRTSKAMAADYDKLQTFHLSEQEVGKSSKLF